jgi:hypothetical protein
MDNRLEQDAIIEDALQNYPPAPMPRDITASVMARIHVEKRPAFVTWNDVAIALVIALVIGTLFITFQNLPPVALAKIHIQGILLYQDILVNARWLVPTVFFGFAALLAGFTLPTLIKMTVDRRR